VATSLEGVSVTFLDSQMYMGVWWVESKTCNTRIIVSSNHFFYNNRGDIDETRWFGYSKEHNIKKV
jgi:hypothetical protein